MPMRPAIGAVLVVLLLAGFAVPENPPPDRAPLVQAGLDAITEDGLRKHVTTLAGDSFEGRAPGTPGDKKTMEYIVEEFQRLKLKPAVNGSYLQSFTSQSGKTQNIVALLEGSDEKLKDTYVVVGGHHDHMGKGRAKNGDGIFNGADDNASGTAGVLEIANAFVTGGLRPKRSILFVTFGAEEQGLLGSKHYVSNPPFPLAKHVAMMNLDMIGRNPQKKIRISGMGTCAEWDGIVKKAMARLKITCTLAPGYTGADDGASDHETFARRRVPVCNLFSGYHADYHAVSDHTDKISFSHLKTTAQLTFLITADVADLATAPAFTEPQKRR